MKERRHAICRSGVNRSIEWVARAGWTTVRWWRILRLRSPYLATSLASVFRRALRPFMFGAGAVALVGTIGADADWLATLGRTILRSGSS